jgi:hypothetical protein
MIGCWLLNVASAAAGYLGAGVGSLQDEGAEQSTLAVCASCQQLEVVWCLCTLCNMHCCSTQCVLRPSVLHAVYLLMPAGQGGAWHHCRSRVPPAIVDVWGVIHMCSPGMAQPVG